MIGQVGDPRAAPNIRSRARRRASDSLRDPLENRRSARLGRVGTGPSRSVIRAGAVTVDLLGSGDLGRESAYEPFWRRRRGRRDCGHEGLVRAAGELGHRPAALTVDNDGGFYDDLVDWTAWTDTRSNCGGARLASDDRGEDGLVTRASSDASNRGMLGLGSLQSCGGIGTGQMYHVSDSNLDRRVRQRAGQGERGWVRARWHGTRCRSRAAPDQAAHGQDEGRQPFHSAQAV